jgi:hypothetical protein
MYICNVNILFKKVIVYLTFLYISVICYVPFTKFSVFLCQNSLGKYVVFPCIFVLRKEMCDLENKKTLFFIHVKFMTC